MSDKKETKEDVVKQTPEQELENAKQIIGKALAQYQGTIQDHQTIQQAFNIVVKACEKK